MRERSDRHPNFLPAPCAAEHLCGRALVRPSTCAAEHLRGRALARPSTCAAEHLCGRALVRPSTCAAEHSYDLAGRRGVWGVSPRQPEILLAHATEEQLQRGTAEQTSVVGARIGCRRARFGRQLRLTHPLSISCSCTC
jgi:hypothetical protein